MIGLPASGLPRSEDAKAAILIDIDNTLLDQVPRKLHILETLRETGIREEDVRSDFGLDEKLKPNTPRRGAYINALYGPDYQQHLVGFPHAADVVCALSTSHQIVYVSSRPNTQLKITRKALGAQGFPISDQEQLELWPAGTDLGNLSEDEIVKRSREWKGEYFSRCAAERTVLLAINDRPEEVALSAAAGIPSVLFAPSAQDHDAIIAARKHLAGLLDVPFIADSVTVVSSWTAMPRVVSLLNTSNCELADLTRLHTNEYSSWLKDLDGKSTALLTMATFLGTGFAVLLLQLAATVPANTLETFLTAALLLTGVIGLLFSCLSMLFAIRAMGSRHTRGEETGDFVHFRNSKYFRNLWGVLCGRSICPAGSPMAEAKFASDEKDASRRRLVHLAFFQRHYGTYDPELIRNQRMLEMRALNYAKIYAEVFSRRCLIISVCVAFLAIALFAGWVLLTRQTEDILSGHYFASACLNLSAYRLSL
ncbi:MAG: hypothetical protein CVT67_06355 [Actinobacteria bacterium HGW-Actinobacteria-7]|nr:MAG: hypothetical protein CVT67_06355 [Actinobacteria bacterium HGW-Actinobacteria-7]